MSTFVPEAPLARRLERIWETRPGWRGWLSTVDHKEIGIRYLVTAFAFLLVGGVEALVLRVQLAGPAGRLLGPEAYNQLFTMHGVTMIFLYALPILSGFSNFLWPLLLGSRDMAFPRLNALSYWIFLFSGLFLYSSFLVGQAPDGGWFNYVPFTERQFNPGLNIDYYALGLVFLGISTTVGSVNFIVSLFKTRAPGMSINRLPILVWGTLTASISNLFAIPALTAACLFLYLDRRAGMHFFDAASGGHPLLWQHLFWMFGHPWVYVIVLPAMGIVSDVIPVFARRPLVGYTFVALATVTTGILGFGVWVHHMFATGLPPLSLSFFSAASIVISIPSAVAVFAWLATIWHGRPVFATPFLFTAGFVLLFTMGGVSGVMTAAIPFDRQLTDTYFVVAHLHYVLIGINVFPVIAGFYFWLPKITGRMLSERLGRWNFWTMFIGFNLGFFPMHIAGLLGMPRRIYSYPAGLGWGAVNLVTTVGAFAFALGVLLFLVNVAWSLRAGRVAGPDPWGAPTLEWSTPSPPPPYNFAVIPTVASRYPLWDADPPDDPGEAPAGARVLDDGRETLGTTPLDAQPELVLRMPGDSYWPLVLALALTALFYGLLASAGWLAGAGAVGVLASALAWLWPEPAGEPSQHPTPLPLAAESEHRSPGWWGMIATVATEAALFAFLIFSYFYLASMTRGAWPTAGPPELTLVLPNTMVLLASSGTMWWAERSIRRGQTGGLRAGLGVTLLLGAAFLAVQGWEYTRKSFGPAHDAYESLFYTITGLHGAHVLTGLVMISTVLVWSLKGSVTQRRHLAVSNVALYWHFVDAVWLVVLTALYLTPHLG